LISSGFKDALSLVILLLVLYVRPSGILEEGDYEGMSQKILGLLILTAVILLFHFWEINTGSAS
jgi:hypothetical protein